jgi:xanthine dehydrogenase small subunit
LRLGARLTLAGPDGARDIAVEDFLLGYRRNALRADEVIARVFIPRPAPGAIFAAEKLSRRHDQDISAIGLAVLLEREVDARGVMPDDVAAALGWWERMEKRPPT